MLSGGSLGAEFNIQKGCFIPKNSPTDGALPRADELRTLGLKNTDNKIITGTNVAQFSSSVSKNVCRLQRGFVQGRQHVLNISDLGAISRAMANFNKYFNEACLAPWDFKAAFPSIEHAWIHAVFQWYGFPIGFLPVSMVSLWFPSEFPWYPAGFPGFPLVSCCFFLVFLWFPCWFVFVVFLWFPLVFLWFYFGFPLVLRWFHFWL